MSDVPANATTWALEREVVLARVINAPRDAVYRAWTTADSFCQWFGPNGYVTTVRQMDVREGGQAKFDMTYEDGTVYTNRFDYIEVVPNE